MPLRREEPAVRHDDLAGDRDAGALGDHGDEHDQQTVVLEKRYQPVLEEAHGRGFYRMACRLTVSRPARAGLRRSLPRPAPRETNLGQPPSHVVPMGGGPGDPVAHRDSR